MPTNHPTREDDPTGWSFRVLLSILRGTLTVDSLDDDERACLTKTIGRQLEEHEAHLG